MSLLLNTFLLTYDPNNCPPTILLRNQSTASWRYWAISHCHWAVGINIFVLFWGPAARPCPPVRLTGCLISIWSVWCHDRGDVCDRKRAPRAEIARDLLRVLSPEDRGDGEEPVGDDQAPGAARTQFRLGDLWRRRLHARAHPRHHRPHPGRDRSRPGRPPDLRGRQ